MSSNKSYSYVVLRYVHDIMTGEFVNVGVVLMAPKDGVFLARTRKTIGRIRGTFPDVDRDVFVSSMRTIDRAINKVKKSFLAEGFFADHKAVSYVHRVLPRDDSALQWSEVGSGVSDDFDKTLDRLFHRFVSRYDTRSNHRISDEDVWRPVREKLQERGLQLSLETKVVRGSTDSIEFSRAWKNGKWHVYEPLSFDLADADGIKDKARRWRGHLEAAADGATEDLQLHFLIGRPNQPGLSKAYNSALEILRRSPFEPQVVEDGEIDTFVDQIEDEIRHHLG